MGTFWRPSRPIAVRLLEKTDREIGAVPEDESLGLCWTWKGAKNTDGYGVIRGEPVWDPETGKRRWPLLLAHRVALSLALGRPLGDGMTANHRCDTPHCVRPAHLYEGTYEENVADMVRRDRHNFFGRRPPIAREGYG